MFVPDETSHIQLPWEIFAVLEADGFEHAMDRPWHRFVFVEMSSAFADVPTLHACCVSQRRRRAPRIPLTCFDFHPTPGEPFKHTLILGQCPHCHAVHWTEGDTRKKTTTK